MISILLAAQPIWDWFLEELSQFRLFCPHFLPDLIPALSSLSICSLGHTKSRLPFHKDKLYLPQEHRTFPTSRSPKEVDTSEEHGEMGRAPSFQPSLFPSENSEVGQIGAGSGSNPAPCHFKQFWWQYPSTSLVLLILFFSSPLPLCLFLLQIY